jgi:hypothetical protein
MSKGHSRSNRQAQSCSFVAGSTRRLRKPVLRRLSAAPTSELSDLFDSRLGSQPLVLRLRDNFQDVVHVRCLKCGRWRGIGLLARSRLRKSCGRANGRDKQEADRLVIFHLLLPSKSAVNRRAH